MNSRSTEHFATNTFEKLDESWKEYLENSTIEDVVALLNSDVASEEVPESLKSLKLGLKSLEYNRKCIRNPRELWQKWTRSDARDGLESEFRVVASSNGVIRKRIKAKKQHEIDRIVELIAQIQTFHDDKSQPIDSLVDIGAGVGHLSRMIALHNKLSVMAVEGNQQFTVAASSLDEKLVEDSRRIGNADLNLNLDNSPLRFTSFVTEELAAKIDEFAENRAILVGLHCCGDFSSTILKVFRKSRRAKALVLLGCCYHKQFECFHFLHPKTENGEAPQLSKSSVFPLSQKWAGLELGYVAREIACHNNENVAARLGNVDLSRYARAHLEKWIWEITDDPDDRNMGMCSVKCEQGKTTFEEYIRKALSKRGNHLLERVLKKVPESELSACVSSLRCPLFDACEILRLLFAPAVESAILDDRVEFLREKGMNAEVVALFEPTVSPRNLAIVAYKDS
ncbi:unnamed protein product [Caenorhabditis sp. 36 PRJEB53466]|nr:unnamed protein product [Caenorhabditis sp. 36 PRJEB53466]